jgi:hypothetical protein
LLAGFWCLRLFGAVFPPSSRAALAGTQLLLLASLGYLLMFTVKDFQFLAVSAGREASLPRPVANGLRFFPHYLLPVVLVWDLGVRQKND